MSEQEETETADQDQVTPEEAIPSTGGERMFTQSELDKILAKERAKEARRVRREARSSQPDTQNQTDNSDHTDVLGEMKSRLDALTEANAAITKQLKQQEAQAFLSRFAGLSKEDAETVRSIHEIDPEKAELVAKRLAQSEPTPGPTGKGFVSPGAPSPNQPSPETIPISQWSKDDIERMRADGTLLQTAEKWRNQQPGGGGGLFRKKAPKG